MKPQSSKALNKPGPKEQAMRELREQRAMMKGRPGKRPVSFKKVALVKRSPRGG
jgi:hypothetical protein